MTRVQEVRTLRDSCAHDRAVHARPIAHAGAAARDGAAGLERIHQLMPAAVVLDLVLPTMDGWDVLVELKEPPDVCHLPVIIVSMLDDRGRGMALGADEYLVKPVQDWGVLQQTVTTLLARGPRP